ncbi:uncharacterized protein LOC113325285 [Papaver somniferum]|uniref:uncharacterized protein LOC113325285 n=1 Tax=Papaver somniferum TaxID=3469 RepID=UPI000E700EEA|nr:uncharacterized protein LOC113325285 [Papaver somniferum]
MAVVANLAITTTNSGGRFLSSQDRLGLADILTDTQWEIIVQTVKTSNNDPKEKIYGKWILDTGASRHMTGSKEFLFKTHEIGFSSVKLPSCTYSHAPCEGTVVFENNMKLLHVLFVPDLHCNLISLACLIKDLKCVVTLTDKLCVIQDRTTRTMVGVGEKREDISFTVECAANRVSAGEDYCLWHRRLGHASNKVISLLPGANKVDCQKFVNEPYDICFKAKQTRTTFPVSENKADDFFDLVHCDVWGPYRTPSSCGAHYFLTIVDDILVFFENKFSYTIVSSDNNNNEDNNIAIGVDEWSVISAEQSGLLVSDSTQILATRNQGSTEQVSAEPNKTDRIAGLSAASGDKFVSSTDLSQNVSGRGSPMATSRPNINVTRRTSEVVTSHDLNKSSFEDSETFVSSGVNGNHSLNTSSGEASETFVSTDVHTQNLVLMGAKSGGVPETNDSSGVNMRNVTDRDSPGNIHLPDNIATENFSEVLLPATENNEVVSDISNTTVRRSARSRVPNTRLRDYVCNTIETIDPDSSTPHSSTFSGTPYPITNYVSCANFSANHTRFLVVITILKEPTSYAEVVRLPVWRVAMSKEIGALDKNGTLSITDLPPGKKAIGCK